jgi:hypothetical protein
LKISDNDRTCLCSVTVFILSVLLFTIIQSCKKLDFERVVRLKTGEVTDITANSAYITGIIQDWGEGKITTYGHCWSVEENPTKFLKTKTEYDHIHLGEFYSSLDSLLPVTTYFVRAYAVYEGETIYGERLNFTTASITGWQKSLGGSGDDDARSIQQTTDGGYIIAGYTNSNDDDVLENHGGYDSWIVKLTSTGQLDWQKSFGGSSDDGSSSIQQTTDGGYIIAGDCYSDDGDVTMNYGECDYWIVKLSSTGDIDWQKSLGGSSNDWANFIKQTTDGGYIIAGQSNSNDGDVLENHGNYDYWIVKLSSTGQLDWQKSLGGSGDDDARSIQQTTDGGYIIAGFSNSNDGDVLENHGDYDCWIVKLTSTGDTDWQKSLGGSGDDGAYSIQQTTDGGYIVAGDCYSDDGDVLENHGDYDCWIVKLTSTGDIDWQKSFGGSSNDWANFIEKTTDGGYIIAGDSKSNDGNVSGNHGDYDYWIVKLTSTGQLDWQKSLGGSGKDDSHSIQQTTDGGYIIAGDSKSNDGNVSGNHGDYDYWIVKIFEN